MSETSAVWAEIKVVVISIVDPAEGTLGPATAFSAIAEASSSVANHEFHSFPSVTDAETGADCGGGVDVDFVRDIHSRIVRRINSGAGISTTTSVCGVVLGKELRGA